MMKAAILGAALLTLGACSLPKTLVPNAQTSVTVVCGQYTNVLETLTIYKSELSDDTVAAVNTTNALTQPICSDIKGVEDYQQALFSVRAGLRELERAQREIE